VGHSSEQMSDPLLPKESGPHTVAELAELLRALRRRHARRRQDRELTYRELAARTGWSHTAIAEYFSGKTLAPTDRFDVLIRLLDTSPAEQGRLATARDRLEELRRTSRPSSNLAAPPTAVGRSAVPRQLPAAVTQFVGRTAEMSLLNSLLDLPATADTVVISAIGGTAGIGKTALAVHWAHRVAGRFPDGQLYVNLRGFDPSGQPTDPHTAICQILGALDVPADRIPSDPDAQVALYRSVLAGRRMLIVLDNARDTAQVRPLLPGTPECLVLITSRSQLTSLIAVPGAHPINLDLFTIDEAREVLTRQLGADRVAAEPTAVADIIIRCARLPLALAIVAARAASFPGLPLHMLADQLADSRERLDTLIAEDDPHTNVRAVMSWSCRALTPAAARLFRLLGWFPGPSISAEAAAILVDTNQAEASRLLTALTAAHLLEDDTRGRYRCHDLLRAYASERAWVEEGANERVDMAGRLLDWYLHRTVTAAQLLEPGHRPITHTPSVSWPAAFATYEQAMEWCDVEQGGAVARIELAAETGHDEYAWKLFVASGNFFLVRKSWVDRISCGGIALRAAQRAGDRYGEAFVLNSLGLAYFAQRREEALVCFQEALQIRQEIGDQQGEAATLNNLGPVYWELRRFDEALTCLCRALTMAREANNQHSEIIALNNLGEAHFRLRRFGEALPYLQQALTLARALNYPVSEGFALHNLGKTYSQLGQFDDALELFQQTLAVRRQADDRHGAATTLVELGNLFHDAGRHEVALQSWRQALTIYEDLGAPETAKLRHQLETSSPTDPPTKQPDPRRSS